MRFPFSNRLTPVLLALALPLAALTGCQTPNTIPTAPLQDFGTLGPGDVLKVTFPGAPELNQVVKVRADGKISLPIIGDQDASGKRVGQLQADLARLYRTQLQNTEVFVSLQNSTTAVYVSGAVTRPGKILLDRPMTVLEAIMEAGGPSSVASLKKVVVIRNDGGEHQTKTLDLSAALRGEKSAAFPLRAYDIVHVPERFF